MHQRFLYVAQKSVTYDGGPEKYEAEKQLSQE